MNGIEDQARSIFLAALERTAEQWPAFLAEACGDNAELRARVEQLLQTHQAMGSIHGGGPGEPVVTVEEQPIGERPGATIGPYKLIQKIGEGGMGTVWMAQQTEPVKRLVAVKLIKAGMDSRQVIARFEAERQALALMDHPNIAKVHDGGATPSGRPYFVMELVKGVPITEFCDQNHLTPRQRLELFVPVCAAVQHAHQKGIIHRDLKPSNVLVSRHDTTPTVKVIDFGVAKSLGQELTDKTLFTGLAQMIGTPLYMSPEQAGMSDLDVDTRSDIYSLGVLLYELLTGTTPFSKERFKKAGYDEIRRIIREEEPPRPSTRLSESTDCLPSISAQRQTEPAKLMRLVRGELDWIVMRALEKDRNRRYETANGFAMDVQRYLADEPVRACSPSAAYRLRKFARRNKRALATALALGMMLLLAVAALALSHLRVTDALADRTEALADRTNAYSKLEVEQGKTAAALQRETGLKNELSDALDQERLALYSYRVSLAQREWEAGRLARADSLLEECPPHLRRWEWHYLKRQCNPWLLKLPQTYPTDAKFSPDGKWIAVLGLGRVSLWDAATGRTVRRLEKLLNTGRRLAFSPDGRLLAACGNVTVVWDMATGQPRLTLQGHQQPIEAVAFSTDGKRLATADHQTVRVWALDTGEELFRLPGHNLVMFTPDGQSLVCQQDDFRANKSIIVVDAATGKERTRWQVGLHPTLTAALSPAGTAIALLSPGGYLRIYELMTGKSRIFVNVAPTENPGLAFDPGGTRLAVVEKDSVGIWDTLLHRRMVTIHGHTHFIKSVAWSPDGRRLVTSSLDGTVRVWDPTIHVASQTAGEDLRRKVPTDRSVSLAFSPDSRWLAMMKARGQVTVLDAGTAEILHLNDDLRPASGTVAFSPDSRRLLFLRSFLESRLNGVQAWDVQSRKEVLACKVGRDQVYPSVFSPDGRTIVIAKRQVEALDMATGKQVFALPSRARVDCFAFSPNGQRLAVAEQRQVRVWEVATGRLRTELPAHTHPITSLAYSRDGRILAFGSQDRTVKFWDVQAGRELRTLGQHDSIVVGIAFHPDGDRLAAMTQDGALVLWDVTSGREALTLTGDRSLKNQVAFSPDGHWLASTGEAGAWLWDGTPWKGPGQAPPGLAQVLRNQRVLDEAAVCYRVGRGMRLGNRLEEAVISLQRAITLDPGFGEARLEFGNALCGQQKWEEALAVWQKATALGPEVNERAARLAAQIGCGKGGDAARLDDQHRARWRMQALQWLRADLTGQRKLLEGDPERARVKVPEALRLWKRNVDYADLREPAALAKLPGGERQAWEQLWADVEALLQQALTPPGRPARGDK